MVGDLIAAFSAAVGARDGEAPEEETDAQASEDGEDEQEEHVQNAVCVEARGWSEIWIW